MVAETIRPARPGKRNRSAANLSAAISLVAVRLSSGTHSTVTLLEAPMRLHGCDKAPRPASNVAKVKGTFPCPSSAKRKDDYAFMIRCEDGLDAFRKRTSAKPSRPVPSRKRVSGSGTGPMKV